MNIRFPALYLEDASAIRSVEFTLDGKKQSPVTAPPWSLSLASGALAAGDHTISAVVTDAFGVTHQGADSKFTVPGKLAEGPIVAQQLAPPLKLAIHKIGKEVLLTWPQNRGRLEMSPTLAPGSWQPLLEESPWFVPTTLKGQFFRLSE